MLSAAYYEAKATNAVITEKYMNRQIYGMIDAAANTAAKEGDQRASLTLILTSDAQLSEGIVAYAVERNVYLYRSDAALDDETGEFTLSDPACVSCKYTSAGIAEYIRQFLNYNNYDKFGTVNPIDHTHGLPKVPGDPDPAEIDIVEP